MSLKIINMYSILKICKYVLKYVHMYHKFVKMSKKFELGIISIYLLSIHKYVFLRSIYASICDKNIKQCLRAEKNRTKSVDKTGGGGGEGGSWHQ
jgi:hypothetical protein